MRIELWHVGKTRTKWISNGEDEFLKKCGHYGKINTHYFKATKAPDPLEARRDESAQIISKLEKEKGGYNILLDERGEMMSSPELAKFMGSLADNGRLPVRFITGGAYGVDDALRQRADKMLSFSPMVFPHELIRLMLSEQLYRAFTILRGESYHHE